MEPNDRLNSQAEDAWYATTQLFRAIELGFEGSELKSLHAKIKPGLIQKALEQHENHLHYHGVDQKRVDAYKLVCWIGCSVLSEESINPNTETDCPFKIIARALIETLCGFLGEDSRGKIVFAKETRELLLQMLIAEETQNPEHGIWQNGLYAAFHCSVVSLRLMETAA